MAYRKIKDLAVAAGKYTDRNGDTKNRYENIGSVFEDDSGKQFLTIKATFSPAGIERQPGKDSIMVSMFEPKDDNRQQTAPAPQQQQRAPAQHQSHGGGGGGNHQFEDDLPW
jgi:hypothetical protein